LFGPAGERRMALEDLYRVPKKEGEREHDLRPGEILTEVLLPPAAGRKVASYEVRQRETLDWSLATASVALEMNPDGTVGQARVVLGQVAPMPWVSIEAAALLKGKRVDADLAAKAGEAAVQKAFALEGNRYKIQLVRVAVKRALIAAAGIIMDEDS
jgi:xanthine dehydrogenase YagS FAD-binding subunit